MTAMRLEVWRIGYAYAWLAVMATLAGMLALGKVEEKTSYGLMPIVVALATASPKWPIGGISGNESNGSAESSGGVR